MENKNELSDIVLEKETGKALKAKRVLIIISILIILFLIVILSMKLFNNPTENKTQNLVLPPEPTSNVVKTKKDEELFKQVPIIEENITKKDNFEKIVKNLKEKESKIKQVDMHKVQKEASVKPIIKATRKTIIKPKIEAKTANTIADKGVYIQVGATSKHSPNKKFLKKISTHKLNYRLLPITIKDKKMTKILIGPYKNRAIARKSLAKIKKNFNKNSFIYTVK